MSETVSPQQMTAPPGLSVRHRLALWTALTLALVSVLGLSVMVVWQWRTDNTAMQALESIRTQHETAMASVTGLEERLTRQAEFADQLAGQVNRLSTRLTAVDVSDAENAVIGLQRILIRQERDYRDFLTALQRGMLALDRLIPRSGAWRQELEETLREGMALSEAREDYVFSLRE
ncbi:MAG: hypothetical protein ACQETO_08815 [Pseudomonadota bacterium]